MTKSKPYRFVLSASLLFLILGGLAQVGNAQVKQDTLKGSRSDTSQIKQKLKNQNQTIRRHNFDRSTHKYLSRENKRFNVPQKKEYYQPPATGQKSLNAAMKALRHELENSITSSRFYQILTKIAPYINNVFVFGYYNQTAPVVGPANPYLYPQTKKGQAERNYIEQRHYSNSEGENQK